MPVAVVGETEAVRETGWPRTVGLAEVASVRKATGAANATVAGKNITVAISGDRALQIKQLRDIFGIART